MIRYALRCHQDHAFDSWFASAAAYDDLAARRLVACPTCGSTQVDKALMTPALRPDAVPEAELPERPLSAPADPMEAAVEALRRQIEENTVDVGRNFASEARRMHEGLAPERAIRGEARIDEARKLLEDGIPVAPLPFIPRSKAN